MGNKIKVTKINPPVLTGFARKVLYQTPFSRFIVFIFFIVRDYHHIFNCVAASWICGYQNYMFWSQVKPFFREWLLKANIKVVVLRDSTPCFVGPTFVCHATSSFCGLWPHCSCLNDQVALNTAPAHQHVTRVAVYLALFFMKKNKNDFLMEYWRLSCKSFLICCNATNITNNSYSYT